MTGTVFVAAPAKVNLVLRVGAQRADGYHNVDTLFAAVGLCDGLRVERAAGGIALQVTGADLGDPRDNLVYRAARAYLRARGRRDGVAIRLEKRIPVGGGLGGGSSDAAATLRCLDELFPPPVGVAALTAMARGLGADVPFFLCRSPLALGSGRGDRLTPLRPLPARPVLLVGSREGVGTAWAYNLLARGREQGGVGKSPEQQPPSEQQPPPEQRSSSERPPAGQRPSSEQPAPKRPSPLAAAGCSDWSTVARLAHNDFETPVFAARPDLRNTVFVLRDGSPLLALMSGSGSTVFAVYKDGESAERARGRVQRIHRAGRVYLTSTLSSFPAIRQA